MPIRSATAQWNGTLKEGNGKMDVESGAFSVPFSFTTRFEDEPGTNPEELIGAAHAGCYSMFLSALLTKSEYTPTSITTTAKVHLGKDDLGPAVTKIELVTKGIVPGLSAEDFGHFAQMAKEQCPISKSLAAVSEVTLDAELV
jgi:osmotically inducible protein OsmC